jgi:uncharacterized protein with PIN domain
MPNDIKLLIDEDTHLALAEALRSRGYDTVHVCDVERRGKEDNEQLEFAVANERTVLTFNVGDFVRLHVEYVESEHEHFGIILSSQKPIGPLLREMLAFLQSHSAEEIHNRLWFL